MGTDLKTKPGTATVAAYLDSLTPEQRSEAKRLQRLFREATGARAKLWGTSIIGYGEYHYTYESGRAGDFLATGFSMRKSGPTIYIMPGYEDYSTLLAKLGPHSLGKSCLYLKSLDDIDQNVLKRLIKTGLRDLKKKYLVKL